jgi:glycosyltransferase involved in cell wall biosynthesis
MDKGVPVLIQAVEIFHRRHPRLAVRAIIVGPPAAEMRDVSGDLADLIMAPGWVYPQDVPPYLRALDVCVLPLPWTEHFAYEASPMKLFEYMASGTPIVASDLPAIAEVLHHEGNALLVPPGDAEALAAALTRLRGDVSLGRRLAAQAALDVRDYAWRERAGRILRMTAAARP